MRRPNTILFMIIIIAISASCQKSRNKKFGEDLAGVWTVDTAFEFGGYNEADRDLHEDLSEDSAYFCSGSMNLDENGTGWIEVIAHQSGQSLTLINMAVSFHTLHEVSGDSWDKPRRTFSLTDAPKSLKMEIQSYYYDTKSFENIDNFFSYQDDNYGKALIPYGIHWTRN